MKSCQKKLLMLAATLVVAAVVYAIVPGKAVVVTKSELKWKNMGIPGVDAAPVSGNMKTGPSRFFLKYPAGFVTPSHHHSADHYATVMSGTITLTVNGKKHRLGPGSYFSLTDQAPHVAKVEGKEPAVFFIQADGPWDVVMEK